MSLFESYSREQLREIYAQAWRKHLAGAPVSPLEAMIVDVVGLHPEYHAMVDAGAEATGNAFLHMGLHMAVREQSSIDRPPGVRELLRQLQARLGDAHAAEHVLMEALGETLWEAQRAGRPPDEGHYLALAQRKLPR
jgi:beta-phosphoglucomutase-like phosphatase (HAD superfamily)